MAKIKKKAKVSILLIFIIIIISVVFVIGYNYVFSSDTGNKIPNFTKPKEEDPIKTYKASLIATGDGLLHSPIYQIAYNSDTKDYDFSHMLEFTKEKIKDYDIKYYNQETVFDDSIPYKTYPTFNTPSKWGLDMIEAGFNMVSLATNHSMDMGATSAVNSALWWEGHNEVLTSGMSSSLEERNNHQIKDANGITYTMLSYTYGTNGIPVPSDMSYVVNVWPTYGGTPETNEEYIAYKEQVKEDVEAVRDLVDVLIVAVHWGNEYEQGTITYQKDMANYLASLDVDIVLGTHSHCIEPWEIIDDTVVFYSFGNFISNQMGAYGDPGDEIIRKVGIIGMFATLDITKTVDTKNNTTDIKIDNIGADLTLTYRYQNKDKGNRYDYNVIPFSKMSETYLGDQFEDIKSYIKSNCWSDYATVYNEFSDVLKSYDDSIKIEPLPEVVAN